jgi:hypothetical protein
MEYTVLSYTLSILCCFLQGVPLWVGLFVGSPCSVLRCTSHQPYGLPLLSLTQYRLYFWVYCVWAVVCVRDSRYTPRGVVHSTDQREYRIARPRRGHALTFIGGIKIKKSCLLWYYKQLSWEMNNKNKQYLLFYKSLCMGTSLRLYAY